MAIKKECEYMSTRLFKSKGGLKLLAAPVTEADKVNNKRRGIIDTGRVTAAQLLSRGEIPCDGPMLFCGSSSRSFGVIKQTALRSQRPVLLVGTEDGLLDSCFLSFNPEWTIHDPSTSLQSGCGCMVLEPCIETINALEDCVSHWRSHYPVLFLGNGLMLNSNLFDQLNMLGSYAIVSSSLNRSIRRDSEATFQLDTLIKCMEMVVVSSAGSACDDLISVLPVYNKVKAVNTMNYQGFQNRLGKNSKRRMHGGGLGISQARSEEPTPYFTEDELRRFVKENKTLFFSPSKRSVVVAELV